LLEQVTKQFEETKALQQKLTEQSNNLIELENTQTYMLDTLHRLDQHIGTVATVLDTVDPKQDHELQLALKDKEESTKRFMTLIGVATAILTTLGAVSVPFSNVVIEWVRIHTPTKNK
jgi:translation initiation factor 2B subunit (eIF-2B alpha/beta/delta family)